MSLADLTAIQFSHAAWYFVVGLMALCLLGGAAVCVHDILEGAFRRWGYWRRLLSARADQFCGPRTLRP